MGKIKRFFSIVLAVNIIFAMTVFEPLASVAAENRVFPVADFTVDADISAFGFSKNTTVYYESRNASACWETGGSLNSKNTSKFPLGATETTAVDLSGMKSLHILMKNIANVGNQMNILFFTEAGYFRAVTNLDFTGWKEVVISLSDIAEKNGVYWDEVLNIQFNYQGWGAAFLAHSPVYFDSIWFEEKAIPDRIEVANGETLPELFQGNSTFVGDTHKKHLYSKTAKWNGEAFSVPFSVGEYHLPAQEYLYQWIYSPENTGEEIEIRLMNTADSSYVKNTFTVDWEGWKLVKLKTENFAGSGKLRKANAFCVEAASSELYFDRIWFSHKEHPTVLASDLFATGEKLPLSDAQIKLKLSEPMATSAQNAVKISENGNSFTEFTASKSGDEITITIPTLEKNVSYEISLSENATDSNGTLFSDVVPIKFSAHSGEGASSKITLKDNSGNEISSLAGKSAICASAVLTPAQGDTLTLVVSAYNGDVIKSVQSVSGNSNVTTPILDITSANCVKAWVVSEKYGVLTRTSLPDNADEMIFYPAIEGSNYALNSVYYETDKFVLDTSYTGKKRKAFMMAKDESEKIIVADEFYIEKDEMVSINIQNIGITQGKYSVSTTLIGETTVKKGEVYYISPSEEASVLASVNSASKWEDILTLMNGYPHLFRVNNITDKALLEHIALVLYEEKTYGAFSDVYDKINFAKEALEKLNQTDWSLLNDYFNSYTRALGSSDAGISYSALSENARLAICRACAESMPFDSFISLRSCIELLIREYEENGAIDIVTKPVISGLPSGSDEEYGSDYKDFDTPLTGFNDLADYKWAEQSIMTLLENNIIAVDKDKKFRPEDAITRAEFVKILVKTIGLDISDKTSVYKDAGEDKWYTPYFNAASKAGIVTGYPDGSVKPEATISREDMAVIIERTLSFLETEFVRNNENAVIADYDLVSEYAKSAVKTVVECSVMKGVGNDSFAPQLSTNRASAAVVAARVFKGLQSGGVFENENADTSTDITGTHEYLLLNAIGVIDDNDPIHFSSTVTRREFARMLYAIALPEDGAQFSGQDILITDIKNDDADYNEISTVCALGYMTVSDGSFRPDEPMNMYEFARGAVGVLGYSFMAEGMGGYPSGYMNVCSKLKLLKNSYLDSFTTISNREFVNLLFNLIQASPAQFSGITTNDFSTYTVNEYNTLLYHKFGVYKLRGLLEGDMFSDIMTKKPRATTGEIVISGKEYPTLTKDVNKLVGHMVEAYVEKEDDRVITLFSHNTEELVFTERFMSMGDREIRYSTDSGKSYDSIKYLKDVSLLYNGRQVSFNKELFKNINGQIFAIDYNSDNIADVIKIYNYQTLQISTPPAKSGVIGDALGGKGINLSNKLLWEDYLLYKNGEAITLEELKKDDIVSYIEINDEPKLTIMYVCDKSISGKIEGMDDDEVFVNQNSYYLAKSASDGIVLGATMQLYFDFLGNIAVATTVRDMVYGYLWGIYPKNSIGSTVIAEIFTENNRWVKLELADRVKFGDESEKAKDVLEYFGNVPDNYRQLIRYNVNEDAKVTKILLADTYEAWSKNESAAMAKDLFRLSHSGTNVQYYNTITSFETYMPVSEKTIIFLVPPLGGSGDREDCFVLNYADLAANKKYASVMSYDADKTFVARAVLIRDTADNAFANSNQAGIAPMMIVTKVANAINAAGSDCYKLIGGYNSSEKMSFNTVDMSVAGVSGLIPGDLVQLSINREGYVFKVEKLYSADKGFKQFLPSDSPISSITFMGGEVKGINADAGRMVVQCDITDKGTAVKLDGACKIYIYNIEDNTVSVATKNDIMVGDSVFFGARYLSVQRLVIFR